MNLFIDRALAELAAETASITDAAEIAAIAQDWDRYRILRDEAGRLGQIVARSLANYAGTLEAAE